MEHHVNVLFKNDNKNRMIAVNEPPYDTAPYIFVGGTRLGNVVRYSNRLDEGIIKKLEQVIDPDTGVDLGGVIGILSRGRQISNFWTGPAFLFPNVSGRITDAIQITESNKGCLKLNFPHVINELEYRQPCFAIIKKETAVSICCSARQTNEVAEASLATLEKFRGRAYAIDVANAWAAEIQSQGRTALYSTSWDNFASQSVARKLKLTQYGTDFHMR